jgi:hypothetical protein
VRLGSLVLVFGLMIALGGCPASPAAAAVEQWVIDLDITPPDVSITSQLGLTVENGASPTINLSGTASDDLQIATVKWYTSRGFTGDCAGLASWTANNIPLSPGENLVTIAATDIAGNVGVDCVTVVRSDIVNLHLVVPTDVTPKQVVDVSVQYTNSSDTTVNNVTVSVHVPDKMDYVTGSAEATGGVWNPSDGTVSWVLTTLNASESGTKTFKARVQ